MRDFLTGTALVFNLVYTLALYAGMAVSLYAIAKNNNVRHAWLAFVPVLQYYIIGTLCEEYVVFGFRIRCLQWSMVGLELLQTFLGFFGGFLFFPVRILVNLLLVLVLHKFFYLFDPRRAVLYALLTMLGRLPLVILLFVIKDKPMVMSAGAFPYPFARR